jgi:hypothetical protein
MLGLAGNLEEVLFCRFLTERRPQLRRASSTPNQLWRQRHRLASAGDLLLLECLDHSMDVKFVSFGKLFSKVVNLINDWVPAFHAMFSTESSSGVLIAGGS